MSATHRSKQCGCSANSAVAQRARDRKLADACCVAGWYCRRRASVGYVIAHVAGHHLDLRCKRLMAKTYFERTYFQLSAGR